MPGGDSVSGFVNDPGHQLAFDQLVQHLFLERPFLLFADLTAALLRQSGQGVLVLAAVLPQRQFLAVHQGDGVAPAAFEVLLNAE